MKKYLFITTAVFSLVLLSFSNKKENKKPFEGVVIYTVSMVDKTIQTTCQRVTSCILKAANGGGLWLMILVAILKLAIPIHPKKQYTFGKEMALRFWHFSPPSLSLYNKHVADSIRQHASHFIYTTETKVIAGHTCKKLYEKIVTIQNTKDSVLVPVYYTNEIPDYFTPVYLPGLPLELKIHPYIDTIDAYTVSSIIEKSLPDSLFVVTPYYKPLKPEDVPRVMDSVMRAK